MIDDKIICPLHNASFSVENGYPEQGPVLDGLPVFQVEKTFDGKHFVKIPDPLPGSGQVPKAKQDPTNETHMVIVGGGPAGISAAETLRQAKFTGKITILSSEEKLPYDRTILSKNLIGADVDKLAMRSQAHLDEFGISFRGKSTVKAIDAASQEVVLADNSRVKYD